MSDSIAAMSSEWDFAIVGAGPAGALAAYLLASRGHRVLLLDRSKFPRNKVCGGCLNGSAVAALESAGLGNIVHSLGAPRLRTFRMNVGFTSAEFPLPEGYAISRSALDHALVRAAIARGAAFVDGTSVQLLPGAQEHHRALELRSADGQFTIRAAMVLACDGLRGTLLDSEPQSSWRIARRSRMGVSAITDSADKAWSAGVIHMSVAAEGYVGAVVLEDGRLNIAAALDLKACRRTGGPDSLVRRILKSAGRPCPRLPRLAGTGLLTRKRSRFGSHRVLAIGDAAAYVEPFTGEGIAWALAGARASISFAERGLTRWSDSIVDEWTAAYGRLLGSRRAACAAMTQLLRFPSLAAAGLCVSRVIPAIAGRLINSLNRPAAFAHRLQLGETP